MQFQKAAPNTMHFSKQVKSMLKTMLSTRSIQDNVDS